MEEAAGARTRCTEQQMLPVAVLDTCRAHVALQMKVAGIVICGMPRAVWRRSLPAGARSRSAHSRCCWSVAVLSVGLELNRGPQRAEARMSRGGCTLLADGEFGHQLGGRAGNQAATASPAPAHSRALSLHGYVLFCLDNVPQGPGCEAAPDLLVPCDPPPVATPFAASRRGIR